MRKKTGGYKTFFKNIFQFLSSFGFKKINIFQLKRQYCFLNLSANAKMSLSGEQHAKKQFFGRNKKK